MANGRTVHAAGAVLWRDGDPPRVAVVHRDRYDDWSLPKGKLDPGETVPACAAREIAEETGYRAVLGRHLAQVRYPIDGAEKVVDYYAARAAGGEFAVNHEVGELRWLPVPQAAELLTYQADREVLAGFAAGPARTTTVLLVRHAKAGDRREWDGDDDLRPLSPAGERQAEGLRRLLPLFGADRVHSAPRLRCEQTVAGLAADLGVPVVSEPLLSEEGFWPDPQAGLRRLREIAAAGGTPVVSSQGGVIPGLLRLLGANADHQPLPAKKGSLWVLTFAPAAAQGTSTSDSADPLLIAADYLPSALATPVPEPAN